MKDQELAEIARDAYQGWLRSSGKASSAFPAWLAAAKAIREQVEAEARAQGMREAAEIAAVYSEREEDTQIAISIIEDILSAIPNHTVDKNEMVKENTPKGGVCEWEAKLVLKYPTWESQCGYMMGHSEKCPAVCPRCNQLIKIKENGE